MSEKIVQLNEEVIKDQLKELVRGSVEETLNELLEQEAEQLRQAARYERNEARQGYRSGHYDRNLTTTSGNVTLHVPMLMYGKEASNRKQEIDRQHHTIPNQRKQRPKDKHCGKIQKF